MGSKTHYRKVAYSYQNNSYMFNIYTRKNYKKINERQICLNANNIIFVRSGSAEIRVGDRIKFVRAGDIIIAKDYTDINWSSCKEYQSLSISFDTPGSAKMFGEAITELLSEFKSSLTVLRLPQKQYQETLKKVFKFLQLSEEKQNTLYIHLWIDILYSLHESIEDGLYYLQAHQIDQELINIISLVEQYIYVNHTEKITTDDLASLFNINRTYLCSIFKLVTGFTINQYINYIRVQKAKYELATKEESIIDISYLVGYHSVSQFNRQFKLISGLTPTQYRTKWKSN